MKLLYKNTLLKIRKSIGRFFSLLLIVALGVGFFAGLRETSPNMLTTLDEYYDEQSLMDFKITSTMGLTDDDINALNGLEYVSKVIPSYSVDTLNNGESIRVHAMEKEVNKITLIDGRMPVNDNECVAEEGVYKIGDKIHLNRDGIEDYIENNEFLVVGTAKSSMYIGMDKGISNVGNGKLTSYIFVPRSNFVLDYFTEVFLIANNTKEVNSYDDKYDKYLEKLESELLKLKPIREAKRYEEILEKATDKIIEIEMELNEEREKAEKELNDTKNILDSYKREIDDGFEKLKDSEKKLNKEMVENENKILLGFKQLEKGKIEYKNGLSKIGKKPNELHEFLNELKIQVRILEELILTLEPDSERYIETRDTLLELKMLMSNVEKLILTGNQLKESEKELIENEKKLKKEISEARLKIDEGKRNLMLKEQELSEGYIKYSEGVLQLNEKISEANKSIQNAKEELDDIEKPVWYLLDRTKNVGYIDFKEDALKVEAISKVFPVFFIIIVYLMSLNTMTRMIEEERTEIGILSSLGYSKYKIMVSYLFYVFVATIFGLVLGLAIGYNVIPRVIYGVYNSNYILPKLKIFVKIIPLTVIVIITMSLMIIVTLVAILKELKDFPSNLLRPKAPKVGKKVMLENIPLIWERLSFTWKVTVRNMFRYKKRIFMTVLGIAGCTGLLLTGFGLKDGIGSIVDLQYRKIIKYDLLLILDKKINAIDDDFSKILKDNGVNEYIKINQESYNFKAKGKTHDVFLVVGSKEDNLNEYINLINTLDNESIKLPSYGSAITSKMARLLDVDVGDSLKIWDSDNQPHIIYISDIVENYTLHYIYMNDEYYERVFDEEVMYNALLANKDYDSFNSENLIEDGRALAINRTSDNINKFNDVIKGLNRIVYLIIGASCLLAFIVLYNLTTININERIREIATLKVLGFYDDEVSSYVYRETFMLTLIGIVVGFILGIFLHRFVITTAESDNVLFLKEIKTISYGFSFLITLLFTIIVQAFTHFKLQEIDMIDSLKSVE